MNHVIILRRSSRSRNLGRTRFCLGLPLEHLQTGILIHQFAYVQKILEKFNIDKAYSARTPIVIRDLKKDTDPFRPKEENSYWDKNTHTYVTLVS
jgi:hypothetical protein